MTRDFARKYNSCFVTYGQGRNCEVNHLSLLTPSFYGLYVMQSYRLDWLTLECCTAMRQVEHLVGWLVSDGSSRYISCPCWICLFIIFPVPCYIYDNYITYYRMMHTYSVQRIRFVIFLCLAMLDLLFLPLLWLMFFVCRSRMKWRLCWSSSTMLTKSLALPMS